jgi:hypothetical protein
MVFHTISVEVAMKVLGSIAFLIVVCLVGLHNHETRGGKKVSNRVFEMRTYYVHPGKMKALHARFRDHTCKIFEKHGMTMIGFWEPTDPAEAAKKMVYILAFASKEDGARKWAAFRDDPEWQKAKADSEKDGPLVAKVESVYLNPTDYSTIK